VHRPSPSYWPIIVAAGLPHIAYGQIYTYWLAGIGGLLVVGGLFGWGFEPSVDPDSGHGHDAEHHDEPSPEPEPVAAATAEES
jgi:cytochrome c oxidase subunit 1